MVELKNIFRTHVQMVHHTQPHFLSSEQGGFNSCVGVKATLIGPTEFGEVFKDRLTRRRPESQLIGAFAVPDTIIGLSNFFRESRQTLTPRTLRWLALLGRLPLHRLATASL